jgi:hypothetical protein
MPATIILTHNLRELNSEANRPKRKTYISYLGKHALPLLFYGYTNLYTTLKENNPLLWQTSSMIAYPLEHREHSPILIIA